jgi:hypothetical protein
MDTVMAAMDVGDHGRGGGGLERVEERVQIGRFCGE